MDAAHIGIAILIALSSVLILALWRQRRALHTLTRNEARLTTALRVSGIGVFDHDLRTGLIECSPEYLRLWDAQTDAPMTLAQILQTIHPEEREAIASAVAHCHDPAGDGVLDVQQRVVLQDGRVRWVALRATTTFEGDGSARRAVHTIGTATDCTAQRTLDEVVRQVVRVTRIGIFDHDHEKRLIYWSDEQRENYGVGHDEPITLQTFLDAVHPDDRPGLTEAVARAHDPAGAGLFDAEYRIIRTDGQIRWLITRGRTFFSGEGPSRRPIRSIGGALDVTGRHTAEEFLHQRERIHSAVVSQSTEGIALIDSATLHLVEFNDAACAMLGYTREAFASLTFPQLAPDVDAAARIRAQIAGEHSTGGDLGLTELKRRDGSLLPVWLTGRPVSHDNRVDLALVWRDIAGIQRAEAELRRLNSIQRTLSHTNQMITRADTETELFSRICDIAVQDAGFAIAWIGLVEPDGFLRRAAGAGPALAFVDHLKISADEQLQEGQGPGGQALRTGAHAVINRIATDPSMDYWRDRSLDFGIQSVAAFPLRRAGEVIGIFAVHSFDPDHFGVREIALLDDMAADISFGLDALDRSVELQRTRELMRDIEATVHIGSFRLTLQSGALWWSDGTPAVLGLPPGTAANRETFESAFEREIALMLVAALYDAAQFGGPIDIDLPLRGTDGAGRWVRLFGVAQPREDGQTEVSCTLQDVSDVKRLESEVMAAADVERRRLASELHDNLGQLLFGTSLLLGAIARDARTADSRLSGRIDEAGATLREALAVCRTLAHGAAPIDDGGLPAALHELAARINRTGVDCTAVAVDIGDAPLPAAAALELYRIAQEAITNALKHAHCRHIRIELGWRDSAVQLNVSDDGTGLDVAATAGANGSAARGRRIGIGLRTMRYRAARAGGTLELRSQPGLGTSVKVLVPLPHAQEAQSAAQAGR